MEWKNNNFSERKKRRTKIKSSNNLLTRSYSLFIFNWILFAIHCDHCEISFFVLFSPLLCQIQTQTQSNNATITGNDTRELRTSDGGCNNRRLNIYFCTMRVLWSRMGRPIGVEERRNFRIFSSLKNLSLSSSRALQLIVRKKNKDFF